MAIERLCGGRIVAARVPFGRQGSLWFNLKKQTKTMGYFALASENFVWNAQSPISEQPY